MKAMKQSAPADRVLRMSPRLSNYPINPASVKIAEGGKRALERHMKATRESGETQ